MIMQNNLVNYIENIDEQKIQKFIKQTSTNLKIKRDVDRVTADTSWIDMIEEAIPYLDNIIRNPRRFIMQEENIVPIAKAKVVTEESIKHLAQHTGLIQEVKEDGSIIPEKLLNVYREETMDLYENRFIKSLVDNLYVFVTNKLNESDQRSYANIKNAVSYSGEYKTKEEKVKINLTIDADYNDEVEKKNKDGFSLNERIEHLQDVIAAFRSSTFIKSLKEAAPVRSPIRKTNVILKEQNFIKALELWEYLEKNNIKPFTKKEKYSVNVDDPKIKEKYDLGFFINVDSLKEADISNKEINIVGNNLNKLIYNYVLNNDITETELKKIAHKEYKEAINKKNKIKKEINDKFNNLIKEYNKRKKVAISLLK